MLIIINAFGILTDHTLVTVQLLVVSQRHFHNFLVARRLMFEIATLIHKKSHSGRVGAPFTSEFTKNHVV